MHQRAATVILIALLLVLHAQLWFGRGSVHNVAMLRAKIEAQKAENAQAAITNQRLTEEIRDLKEGLEIVEEKARSELGMVKSDEIFVQVSH